MDRVVTFERLRGGKKSRFREETLIDGERVKLCPEPIESGQCSSMTSNVDTPRTLSRGQCGGAFNERELAGRHVIG